MAQEKNTTSLSGHLNELRKMLMYCVISIILVTVLCYTLLIEQLMKTFHYPLDKLGIELIYTGVSEAFIVQIKVALLAGIIFSLPLVFFFVWRFIGPAFFPNEKKLIVKIFPPVLILFAVGILFAYFVVYGYALQFFLVTMSGGLTPMLTISQYINFMYSFILPFGFTFELPLVIFLLSYFGLIKAATLRKKRKYVLLIIVIVSAVITPPDVISMSLLAFPIYMLYEAGILIAAFIEKTKRTKAAPE